MTLSASDRRQTVTRGDLEDIMTAVENGARARDVDTDYLYHNAGGVTAVGAASWVTLASVTVPAGETLKLLYAEADFIDLTALSSTRGIRIQKDDATVAASLTGSNQPNPDIRELILTNSSEGDETWTLQARHGSVSSQNMVGWFTWVRVSD